jgi:hypothetical protein
MWTVDDNKTLWDIYARYGVVVKKIGDDAFNDLSVGERKRLISVKNDILEIITELENKRDGGKF